MSAVRVLDDMSRAEVLAWAADVQDQAFVAGTLTATPDRVAADFRTTPTVAARLQTVLAKLRTDLHY